jgi:hypothetical protein
MDACFRLIPEAESQLGELVEVHRGPQRVAAYKLLNVLSKITEHDE